MKTNVLIIFFICISAYCLFAQEYDSPAEFAYENFHTGKGRSEQQLQVKVFPNPFSSQIQFQFDIIMPAHVRLAVFDVIGKEVSTLVNKQLETDSYNISWKPENRPSGIYIYILSTGNARKTGKVLLTNGSR